MAGKNISSLLNKALAELEQEQRRIEEQIQAIRGLLGKQEGSGRSVGSASKPSGAGRMSTAARKRIGDAQKRRWAEYRKSVSSEKGA